MLVTITNMDCDETVDKACVEDVLKHVKVKMRGMNTFSFDGNHDSSSSESCIIADYESMSLRVKKCKPSVLDFVEKHACSTFVFGPNLNDYKVKSNTIRLLPEAYRSCGWYYNPCAEDPILAKAAAFIRKQGLYMEMTDESMNLEKNDVLIYAGSDDMPSFVLTGFMVQVECGEYIFYIDAIVSDEKRRRHTDVVDPDQVKLTHEAISRLNWCIYRVCQNTTVHMIGQSVGFKMNKSTYSPITWFRKKRMKRDHPGEPYLQVQNAPFFWQEVFGSSCFSVPQEMYHVMLQLHDCVTLKASVEANTNLFHAKKFIYRR